MPKTKKKTKTNFWEVVANLILRNRILILIILAFVTAFWTTQWKYMQFTFTEANLLPDDHPENIQYQEFVKTFGDEGNLIVIAVQDSLFFKSEKRNAWRDLNTKINVAKRELVTAASKKVTSRLSFATKRKIISKGIRSKTENFMNTEHQIINSENFMKIFDIVTKSKKVRGGI